VRPGCEHGTSAARADPDLLARITDWVSDGALAVADLGYGCPWRLGDIVAASIVLLHDEHRRST
jgi:hypothetical protein